MNSVAAFAIAAWASASPARAEAPPTAQELGYPAGCEALYGGTGGLHLIKVRCPGPLIAPPHQDPAKPLLEEARRTTKQLDECLMAAADKLRPSAVGWLEKYKSYRQSCGNERAAAFDIHLRNAWAELTPRNPEERWRAYERATFRVDSRYEIWVDRFLDPRPPSY